MSENIWDTDININREHVDIHWNWGYHFLKQTHFIMLKTKAIIILDGLLDQEGISFCWIYFMIYIYIYISYIYIYTHVNYYLIDICQYLSIYYIYIYGSYINMILCMLLSEVIYTHIISQCHISALAKKSP